MSLNRQWWDSGVLICRGRLRSQLVAQECAAKCVCSCTGTRQLGRRRKLGADDERALYLEKHATVQMIILENVPGLLSQTIAASPYGALKKRLEGLGPPCLQGTKPPIRSCDVRSLRTYVPCEPCNRKRGAPCQSRSMCVQRLQYDGDLMVQGVDSRSGLT